MENSNVPNKEGDGVAKTYYDRRSNRRRANKKKFGRKKFDYVTKKFAAENIPSEVKNVELWQKAVDTVFSSQENVEMRDVLTQYKYLLRVKLDVYARYGKNKNANQ